ncbi:hypothetical protein, partial [Vibrio parahaemolyticus]|uniref:hypothetical protein n=1 Tax=Vibrio parahaemolyticus TaxID=670 RepID=UPI00226B717C
QWQQWVRWGCRMTKYIIRVQSSPNQLFLSDLSKTDAGKIPVISGYYALAKVMSLNTANKAIDDVKKRWRYAEIVPHNCSVAHKIGRERGLSEIQKKMEQRV